MPQLKPAAEYVTDAARYTPEVIAATKKYARSKPWSGDVEQRVEKLQAFHDELCEACDLVRIGLNIFQPSTAGRGGARYVPLGPDGPCIVLVGKLSVVSYLYAFAAALYGIELRQGWAIAGHHDRQMTFAVNLYKQCFPRSFARADLSGIEVR